MIKTVDSNLSKTGVLHNAYNISYIKEENQIWLASFSLPLNDPKASLLKQLEYVHIYDDESDEEVGLFRIMDIEEHFSIDSRRISADCMHVIHTLADSVIDGYYQKDNLTTIENITELLKLQNNKDWVLGQCDFRRFFSYSWENENGLLNALYSIPKPFDEAYTFIPDTSSYPWKINLVRPETVATCRIRETHNLKGLTVTRNPKEMVNRIHAKGIGEGVNSLTFSTINGGKNYVQNDAAIAARGGRIISYQWVDRRFTDKASLLASAKSLLDKWSKPIITWKVSAIDLNKIHIKQTGKKLEIDNLKLGKVVQLDTKKYGKQELRIVKVTKKDITGSPWDITLEIGNVGQTLQGTLADSDRQNEINTNYANGATNLFLLKESDNADSTHPVKLWFNLDDDVAMINQVRLDVETAAFRGYTKAVKGGGAMVGSTSAGGYYGSSTEGGGGSVQGGTSAAGGSAQVGTTSSAGGDHRHRMFSGLASGPINFGEYMYQAMGQTAVALQVNQNAVPSEIWTEGSSGSHNHTVNVNIPSHSHSFSVNIPTHSHNFSVPAHTHQITLPDHTHDIEFGIFEHTDRATRLTVKVDGVNTTLTATTIDFVNIIPFLRKDTNGLVSKGKHTIEILPDKLARISAQITCRVFIRSQVGGEF